MISSLFLILAGLSGCSNDPAPQADKEAVSTPTASSVKPHINGKKAEDTDKFITDDLAYLTQLGLIRGHLKVGFTLYSMELTDHAVTHMKHPRAEIYASLVPAFTARGCGGFADELSTLSTAVTNLAAIEEVTSAYQNLTSSITNCEEKTDITSAQLTTKVIEELLRVAAEEYAIGIIDGKVNNLHEFQDAWGFTQVAQEWALNNSKAAGTAGEVGLIIYYLTKDLDDMWPDLVPEGEVDSDASQLYGAAAYVQVEGFALTR